MRVIFNLRSLKTEKSPLRIIVNYGAFKIKDGKKVYLPFRTQLPWEIPAKLWDKEKGRIKTSASFPNGEFINGVIKKLEASLDDYKYDCHRNGQEIEEIGILEAINRVLSPKAENKPLYLADVAAEVIEKSISGERLSKDGNRISEATVKKYRMAFWHLENFEDRYGEVSLKALNKDFGNVLQTYFNDIGLAHNTKATHLAQYIMFYNYAVNKGWVEQGDFHKARIPDVETDTIALSMKEVDKLFALNLDMKPELDEIRDVFLTGVWTLMRFGDYSDIKSYNLKGELIKVITKKTSVPVYLPIHKQLKAILAKYNNKLPNAPSLQTFNRGIKEIGKRAGIDNLEEIKKHVGGKVIKEIVPRYELIGSHTARRTGATLLYLDNVPKKQIMLLTGHTQEDHFDRYVRIGRYANAKMLSERAFYKDDSSVPQTRSADVEDGFYWAKKAGRKTVVQVIDGQVLMLGNSTVIGLDDFLGNGGKLNMPVLKP